MSTFRVNFEISKGDADLLLSSLSHVAQNTSSQKRRKILHRIIREIKFDHKLESVILNELIHILSPMTDAPIRKSSNLYQQLGLNKTWLTNSLHLICNHIVLKLLQMANSTKKATAISSAQAMKSTTIKDVIKLIKSTYESAK